MSNVSENPHVWSLVDALLVSLDEALATDAYNPAVLWETIRQKLEELRGEWDPEAVPTEVEFNAVNLPDQKAFRYEFSGGPWDKLTFFHFEFPPTRLDAYELNGLLYTDGGGTHYLSQSGLGQPGLYQWTGGGRG